MLSNRRSQPLTEQQKTVTIDNTESSHVPPSSVVIEKFGKQLRQVADARDTYRYVTTACALCEQLKPNLKPLASLEKKTILTPTK